MEIYENVFTEDWYMISFNKVYRIADEIEPLPALTKYDIMMNKHMKLLSLEDIIGCIPLDEFMDCNECMNLGYVRDDGEPDFCGCAAGIGLKKSEGIITSRSVRSPEFDRMAL